MSRREVREQHKQAREERAEERLAPPPPGAWWNGIARKWMIGDPNNPTVLDPQPLAFVVHFPGSPPTPQIPPAVKVVA